MNDLCADIGYKSINHMVAAQLLANVIYAFVADIGTQIIHL